MAAEALIAQAGKRWCYSLIMTRLAIGLAAVCVTGVALAQAPAPLGEFRPADDRHLGILQCRSRQDLHRHLQKRSAAQAGFKVEFDANCVNLFPLVRDIAGWKFPENDLLYLLDAKGKSVVEFSEVEDGIFEAPTPGVGVLFLQNAAAAGAPPKPAEQVAGDWAIVRKSGPPVCALTLAMTKASDGFGCCGEARLRCGDRAP